MKIQTIFNILTISFIIQSNLCDNLSQINSQKKKIIKSFAEILDDKVVLATGIKQVTEKMSKCGFKFQEENNLDNFLNNYLNQKFDNRFNIKQTISKFNENRNYQEQVSELNYQLLQNLQLTIQQNEDLTIVQRANSFQLKNFVDQEMTKYQKLIFNEVYNSVHECKNMIVQYYKTIKNDNIVVYSIIHLMQNLENENVNKINLFFQYYLQKTNKLQQKSLIILMKELFQIFSNQENQQQDNFLQLVYINLFIQNLDANNQLQNLLYIINDTEYKINNTDTQYYQIMKNKIFKTRQEFNNIDKQSQLVYTILLKDLIQLNLINQQEFTKYNFTDLVYSILLIKKGTSDFRCKALYQTFDCQGEDGQKIIESLMDKIAKFRILTFNTYSQQLKNDINLLFNFNLYLDNYQQLEQNECQFQSFIKLFVLKKYAYHLYHSDQNYGVKFDLNIDQSEKYLLKEHSYEFCNNANHDLIQYYKIDHPDSTDLLDSIYNYLNEKNVSFGAKQLDKILGEPSQPFKKFEMKITEINFVESKKNCIIYQYFEKNTSDQNLRI